MHELPISAFLFISVNWKGFEFWKNKKLKFDLEIILQKQIV